MYTQRPYTFDRVVRLVITWRRNSSRNMAHNVLKGVLLPFCIACLIAYLFEPFVQYNRRLLNLKGRLIAIFVTLLKPPFCLGYCVISSSR